METFYEVKNPLHEDITIMVKGVNYTLPADGQLENIPEFAKDHWSSLHKFLSFKKMPKTVASIEDIIVAPVIETPILETEEIVVDEKESEEVIEDVATEVEEVVEQKVEVTKKVKATK